MGSLVGGGPALGTMARGRGFRCSGRGALSLPGFLGRRRFCRGRPMCRPGHVSSRDTFTGGHIGPPLRGAGSVREPTEIGVKRTLHAGRDRARPLPGSRSRTVRPGRRGAPGVWLPPAKFRNGIWGVSHRHRPLRKGEKAASTTQASGAERGVCGAVARDGWESAQRPSQKGGCLRDCRDSA